jgi:hypothetical protein
VRSFVRLIASVVLMAAIGEGQALGATRCPCQYKPAGFKYATSASPIPPAHIACMKIIEQQLQTMNTNSENAKLQSILLNIRSGAATFDYGVPPEKDAEAAVAAATAQASQFGAEQKKSKAELDKAIEDLGKYRTELKTLKSYGLGKDIDRNNREAHQSLVKIAEITLGHAQIGAAMDDLMVAGSRAIASFSNCVANNKLPPTTDMSAIKSFITDKYLVKGNPSKTESDVSNETSPTDNSNKPNVTWDDALGLSAPLASSAPAPPANPAEPDDAYKLYARAEVTGQIAERVCPGAKVNGEKLKEFRRANVRNGDQLATELDLRRVSTEPDVERVGAGQWCGWSKNQFGSEGLDYAGLIDFP